MSTEENKAAQDGEPSAGDEELSRQQEKAVRLNLILDLLTLTPVIAVAVLANSMLLMSDIFEYAKSITSSLIAWYVLRRVVKGDVGGYDYGLGKLEALGGLAASAIMLSGIAVMGVVTSWRLLHPEEVNAGFSLIGLGLQAAGLGINGWLWRRNFALAQRAYSPLIDAQWRANRADTLANGGVLVGLGLTLTLQDYAWSIYIDPLCALIALAASTGAFIGLLRRCVQDLSDKTLEETLQIKVLKRLAEYYEGYESFHGVRSRRVGSKVYIELMLGFHPDKTVGEVMDTVYHLTADLAEDIPGSEVNVVLTKREDWLKSGTNWSQTKILPLSATTLEPALDLIRDTFALTPEEVPEMELAESVTPGKYAAKLLEFGMSDPAYWVAFQHGKVIGVTGFYYKPEDRHEAVWGGWTVTDLKVRGSISRAKLLLLRKAVVEAHATGRKYFRLYTSTVPVEAQANHLYDRVGLKVYYTEPMPDGKNMILYRQAEMADLYERMTAQ